ncbi:MAG TPA: hypothetical protein VER11_34520 [Polyangiaceae bacterium]|nr:hypothetical protein [Polyangiaceae bacterium]
MALSKTSLLWTDPDSGESLSLQFDAVTGETKDDTVTVTDHPVEDGSNVADHARDDPAMLSIEAVVSETPNPQLDADVSLRGVDLKVDIRSAPSTKTFTLDIPTPPIQFSESGLVQAGIGALKKAIFGAPKATSLGPTSGQTNNVTARAYQQDATRNRPRDVYDKLLLLKSQHVRLDLIQTAYRDYTDMMVTRVSQPRATEDGLSAKFQIDFKQIRIASSQTVAAPKPAADSTRANTTQKKGSQGTKPANKAAEHESVAHVMYDALGNAIGSF